MELNVIASPLQGCRDVFDLMPTATQDDWATIATRLTAVPTRPRAVDHDPARVGRPRAGDAPPPGRPSASPSASELTAPDGFFATFLARASADGAPLDDAVRADLERGVEAAAAAYQRIGDDLRTHLLDRAPESDAAGRERYRLASRQFLGASVDLEETYAWGQEELARIDGRHAARTADRIVPGASVKEAIDAPRRRPARTCCTAPTRCATGCRTAPTRSSPTWPTPTSTSPARCAPSSAGSPRPRPAASTTPAPATTSPGRAGCGGRCPRASPSSAPGAS